MNKHSVVFRAATRKRVCWQRDKLKPGRIEIRPGFSVILKQEHARHKKRLFCFNQEWRIFVPVFPAMPSRAFSSRVISAVRPEAEAAKRVAASIFGRMEPGAK